MRIVNDYLPKCTHNEYISIYTPIYHLKSLLVLLPRASDATTYCQDSEYHHLWSAPHVLSSQTHTNIHHVVDPFSKPLRSNSEAFTLPLRICICIGRASRGIKAQIPFSQDLRLCENILFRQYGFRQCPVTFVRKLSTAKRIHTYK